MGNLQVNRIEKAKYLAFIKSKAIEHHARHAGNYAIPGTEAGEYAAQFYADMAVEGEKKGGAKGYLMIAGGWAGGFFASLWTPETALSTTITLGTAGLGAAASVGRLGAASLPIVKTLQVVGSFQGGLSAGQAITGTDLSGEKLSSGARIVHGVFGILTFLSLVGQPNSYLFGRAVNRPGAGAGILNKGPLRLGWSFRSPKLPGGGEEYFALHGGGTFKGVNQGPHWHLYLNHGWPSGPASAPVWGSTFVRGTQIFGTIASGVYGYEMGNKYFGDRK